MGIQQRPTSQTVCATTGPSTARRPGDKVAGTTNRDDFPVKGALRDGTRSGVATIRYGSRRRQENAWRKWPREEMPSRELVRPTNTPTRGGGGRDLNRRLGRRCRFTGSRRTHVLSLKEST
ncbi:hypothetical protein MRX96_032962 [Rhipicephalus microplus]